MNHNFKQGDIIEMNFNPAKGHEQQGYRPALIISNDDYQRFMGLSIVCPITKNMKRFPTHVPLDERTDTYGCILCEHERTVDLKERDAKFKEKVPQDILEEVLNIVHSFY
ncbi:MAG: type II toxin-antitoxin system PemK/MazF family toxin [Longibaculum sp.]